MKSNAATNIDQYIAGFPEDVRMLLEQLRHTISKAAPNAEELISYQMPAFKLNGMLVYFAAYQKHIGFYPTPSGIATFSKELAAYESSKGAVQFPLNKPLPLALISKIVKFRVKENIEKAATKTSKTIKPKQQSETSKTGDSFAFLAAPAQRALANNKINSLKTLSGFSEKEILLFHGIGAGSIPKLRAALKSAGLTFKKG